MQTALKLVAYILIGVLGLLVVGLVSLYTITEQRINKRYDVPVETIAIPAALPGELQGRHRMFIGFCQECHGPGLGGQLMEDDPMTTRLVADNLTSGRGGAGRDFTDADWVRAIRHGIGPNGRSLIVMPSNFFYNLTDADVAVLVAYVKSLPPVDNELPESSMGPMGRFLLLQDPSLLPADVIDHTGPRPPEPQPGNALELGRYLSFVCTACHGPDLSGGSNASAGLNLTPAGDLAAWTEADFIRAMRTGVTPAGKTLNQEDMPWQAVGLLSDEELKAIWLYLQSVPSVETAAGER